MAVLIQIVYIEHAGINLWQYVFFPITLKYCKFLFNEGLAENFPSAFILDDFHLSCMQEKT